MKVICNWCNASEKKIIQKQSFRIFGEEKSKEMECLVQACQDVGKEEENDACVNTSENVKALEKSL